MTYKAYSSHNAKVKVNQRTKSSNKQFMSKSVSCETGVMVLSHRRHDIIFFQIRTKLFQLYKKRSLLSGKIAF